MLFALPTIAAGGAAAVAQPTTTGATPGADQPTTTAAPATTAAPTSAPTTAAPSTTAAPTTSAPATSGTDQQRGERGWEKTAHVRAHRTAGVGQAGGRAS